jgi:hypothetical protein
MFVSVLSSSDGLSRRLAEVGLYFAVLAGLLFPRFVSGRWKRLARQCSTLAQ